MTAATLPARAAPYTPSTPSAADAPASRPHSFGERAALAGGLVCGLGQIGAAVFFAATLAPHMPPIEAPGAAHAAFYAAYQERLALANYLFLLPVPFFLVFLGGLSSVLRRAEGPGSALTTGTVGSGLAATVIVAMGVVVATAGQMTASRGLEGEAVFAFDSVAQLAIAVAALPRATLLAGAALVLLRAAAIPRWLGWTGLALGAIALVSSAGMAYPALFPLVALGYLLPQLWIAALSASLLRRR